MWIQKIQRCQQTFDKITTLFKRVFWNKDKTRGAMEPMPPPETVFEMPKSVPEKFGARSTWLENIWWHTNTWLNNICWHTNTWPNNICWEQMLLEGCAPCHVARWQGTIEPHSQHLWTRRSLSCVYPAILSLSVCDSQSSSSGYEFLAQSAVSMLMLLFEMVEFRIGYKPRGLGLGLGTNQKDWD